MDVFVLNMRNEPLMPCSPAKARILLKESKAVVVRKNPFTIKLTIATGENKQSVTIGVDPGYKYLGICISSEKRVYYVSEIILRTDIPKLLATRKESRRSRRYRKTRYRKPTGIFDFKPKGWFAPSIRHKIDTTVYQIEKLSKMVPISKIIVEIAKFNIQKIKNPDSKGIEYQRGEQLNFWNVREYVLYRDNHQCQHCKGQSNDKILNVHHIESRKTGGNASNNLITLCETCHKKYHNKEIDLKIKRGSSFKAETFMTSVRWQIINQLKEKFNNIEIKTTYGYITKNNRISLNLKKEHYIDAFCIAGNLNAKLTDKYYYQVQKRCHNRQIHQYNYKSGKRIRVQIGYEFLGYRLFDYVKIINQNIIKSICERHGVQYFNTGFIISRRQNGYFQIYTVDGDIFLISYRYLALIEKRKSVLTIIKNKAFLNIIEEESVKSVNNVTISLSDKKKDNKITNKINRRPIKVSLPYNIWEELARIGYEKYSLCRTHYIDRLVATVLDNQIDYSLNQEKMNEYEYTQYQRLLENQYSERRHLTFCNETWIKFENEMKKTGWTQVKLLLHITISQLILPEQNQIKLDDNINFRNIYVKSEQSTTSFEKSCYAKWLKTKYKDKNI